MFQVIGDQAASLKRAIADDKARSLAAREVTLTWKPGKPVTTTFIVGDYRLEPSPITGAKVIVWSNQPKSLQVPVTDNSVPDLVVKRPKQFVVPVEWRDVIRRIRAHGIRFTTLEEPTAIAVTLYRMNDVKMVGGF